jgi:hypothetical protein
LREQAGEKFALISMIYGIFYARFLAEEKGKLAAVRNNSWKDRKYNFET